MTSRAVRTLLDGPRLISCATGYGDREPVDTLLRMLSDWLRRPSVIVAAHPDDEAIGVGTLLSKFQELRAIIHVTDGAPRNGADARNAGLNTPEEYAALRRRELEFAMQEAGVPTVERICLWCPDQEASFRLAEIMRQLSEVLLEKQPAFVFTHSYEGGHPDHDSTALAVHRAVAMLRRNGKQTPMIVEFASYHAGSNGMETECFLPVDGVHVVDRPLGEEEQRKKRKLFDCYQSQRQVLQWFPLQNEPLRIAPAYDFTKPPHEGRLFYEQFSWGITGEQWRKLATEMR